MSPSSASVSVARSRSLSVTTVRTIVADRSTERTPVTDAALASELAEAAGRLLVALRADHGDLPGGELKDLGDRSAQALLAERLGLARPDDCVLSEEAVDDRRRLQADRVWIIDPLDGTREYSEGRHDWAVHVALWQGGS